MRRSLTLPVRQFATVSVVVGVAMAVAAAAAVGRPVSTTPSTTISVGTGQSLFTSVGCSACHTFKAARATGKIGPDLDTVALSFAQFTTQVTNGGCAVMTKAACAKYKFSMSSFKSRLTPAQIADIAVFVYTKWNQAPTGSPPTTTTTTKTKTTSTTTTTAPPPTTTQVTPPTTTTTAPPPVTTTASECPPGQTIQSSGNTDGDDDETGRPSDLDGCI